MTVIVTRYAEPRYRGFLGSVMLEIAPGAYTSPDLSRAVRERVWTVLTDWYSQLGRGSIVMTWRDNKASRRQTVSGLREPPKSIVDANGLLLVK